MIFDILIDDECHARELLWARIKDSDREHHWDSGLLSLAVAGNQECTTFRLGQVVILDILQILFESFFNFFDSSLLVFYTI